MKLSRILILGLGLVSPAIFQPALAQNAQPQSVQRHLPRYTFAVRSMLKHTVQTVQPSIGSRSSMRIS